MRNKLYRILSIILSVAMLFSVCSIAATAEETVTEEATTTEYNYYVKNGSTGNGKTEETAAATVADAINTIVNVDGLGENDVANIYIMQSSERFTRNNTVARSENPVHGLAAWAVDSAVPAAHTAKIVVQPHPDNSGKTYLVTGDKANQEDTMHISGPTHFKDLYIIGAKSQKAIRLNANNVTLDHSSNKTNNYGYINAWPLTGDSSILARQSMEVYFGVAGTTDHEVNINWNYILGTHSITGSTPQSIISLGGNTNPETYNEDVNLTFDVVSGSSGGAPLFNFGNGYFAITYKKNLNINIKSARELVLNDTRAGKVTVEGAYQVIKDSDTWYTDLTSRKDGSYQNGPTTTNVEEFANVTVKGGSYILTNYSSNADLLTFTETAGTYNVNSTAGYAYAYDAVNDPDTLYYGTETLTVGKAGEYDVNEIADLSAITVGPSSARFTGWLDNGDGTMTAQYSGESADLLKEYKDYINYRGTLENTYAKIAAGENVNVVYYGGSVTVGTGLESTEQDTKSWRGLVGTWLTDTFTGANITNINRATGESGTFLGSYRVERDIISENPDLLFIEYSINDYYYKSTYEQAASQYETIVRKVREALPDCDIITILVTDEANAAEARKGNLHTQAQAHEDMATVYNIPTIHVGRALADKVSDEEWGTYMSDNVHPLAAGYEIYYNVIKEYLYNTLMVPEYEEPTVRDHILPALQSETLLDGNITVIEASADLLAKSEELGGSEFFFNSGSTSIHTYNGDIRLAKNDTDTYETEPVFAVEFTGTELAMFAANANNSNQVYIKVDDGEYQLINLSKHNPTVLATGLASRKHTVYIKPDMSTFTMRLAIPVLFARDAAYQTAMTVNYGDANVDGGINILDFINIKKKIAGNAKYCAPADANASGEVENGDLIAVQKHLLSVSTIEWKDPDDVIRNYYVKADATGDGRTASAPAASVVDVLATVNEDGLDDGDTANIYILKGDERDVKGVGEIVGNCKVDSVTTKYMPQHGFTSWVNLTASQATSNKFDATPTHTAKIVVQGLYNTDADPTYLPYSNTLGGNAPLTIGGPTEFKNLTIVGTRKVNQHIYHNGNNVVYDETVKYGMFSHDYTDGFDANYENDSTVTQPNRWDGTVTARNSLGTNVGYNEGGNTASADVNVEFNNAYQASGHNQSIYVEAHGARDNTFTGDVNLTFNNAAADPNVYLGNYSASTTAISGDLNIEVKTAKSFALTDGTGTLNVGGAIQVLVNGADCTGDLLNFSGVTAANGIYFVKVTTKMAEALSLTDTVGTYKVADGFTAIATDAEGNETMSVGGILELKTAGEYTVQVIDYYANNGETITVYDAVTIDLADEEADYKDGQVFVGWTTADGEYADQVATYSRGDVLTAQYVDFAAEDFAIEEALIDTTDGTALSFVIKQNKAFVNALPEVVEYGSITLPSDTAGGREIRLDTPVVTEWQWDSVNVNDFYASAVGETPIKYAAENTEETDTEFKYVLTIDGITEDTYNEYHIARGYIKFKDGNGVERVVYTDDAQNSVYKIAAEAFAAGEENVVYAGIVNYVENTWNVNYRNSLYNGATTLYEDSNDASHKIIELSNGLYERSVTINSGLGVAENELCFYTDPHLVYINEKDIKTENINALSSYRGRTWLRDGSSIRKQLAVSKYASTFDKIVVGGDAVDYLTWGALEVTQNLISRRSVNGSTLMAVGNHEPKDLSQPDNSALTDIDLTEGYNRTQSIWTNDVYYHEEVVNDKNGNPNYMIIVLDNSQDEYWESQIEPLTASIEEARAKQIPILIFQHIPMLTMNPDETAVYERSGYGNGGKFGTATDNSAVFDMNTYSGFLGDDSDSAATKTVCNLIRSSADVVKGVFNGHMHANMYTEIVGADLEGNTVMIPQHTMYGSHYGGVMKITIK